MADAFIDLHRMKLGGKLPAGHITLRAAPNGETVERLALEEGSVAFHSDPLHSPASFVVNFTLAIFRRAGKQTTKHITIEPATRVGGWFAAEPGVTVLVEYLGGGEARVSWDACAFYRPYRGVASIDRSEATQTVSALVLIAVKRAVIG